MKTEINHRRQRGFSHHFVLPIIVILVVGLIGILMLRVSRAAVTQCTSRATLKVGASSTCVSYAKQILNTTSDTGTAISTSNKFDDAMKAKLVQFQSAKNLTDSGAIGKATWKDLCTVAKTNLPKIYQSAGCGIVTVSYSDTKMVNGCGTMQGGTTDGTYLYFACVHPATNGKNTIKIMKYTPDGKKVAESKNFSRKEFGHANAFTYNKNLKLLVVSAWDDDSKGNNGVKSSVRFVDPNDFSIKYTKSLSDKNSVSNICYNPSSNQYTANGRLYDENLKYVKTIYDVSKVDAAIGISGEKKVLKQGLACDASYIYVIRVVFKDTGYNMIAIYDWNGKNVGAYRLNLNDEAENLSIINGVMYLGINEGSMSKGGDYRNDYFVKLDSAEPVAL